LIIKTQKIRLGLVVSFFKKILIFILFFALIVNIVIVIIGFTYVKHNPLLTDKVYEKIDSYGLSNIAHIPEILENKIQSLFYSPEIIQIEIKHTNAQKIEFMRLKALNGDRDFQYVPAELMHNGNKYKIKIRLKGDREVHFNDKEQASYRVKLKGDNTLFGMKNFSVQKPRVRNYIEEWVFLQMMREEGIVTPRYKFIKFIVNGKDLGVYAIEEHYSKYLIENNRRKNGPILKFIEDTQDYTVEDIGVFKSKKWKNGKGHPMAQKAISLLDGFRSGRLSIEETFDEKKLARFFAIVDLNFAWHGAVTKSMRFYYNPISMRLEPIPFDGHRGATGSVYLLTSELGIVSENNWTHDVGYGQWFERFFNKKNSFSNGFYKEYIATLERISTKSYLDIFFKKYTHKMEEILMTIYSELPLSDNISFYGPFPYYFDKESYYRTQENILEKLNSHDIFATVEGVKGGEVTLSIVKNRASLAYEILGVYDDDSNVSCRPIEPYILAPRSVDTSSLKFLFNCNNFNNKDLRSNLKLRIRHPGSESEVLVNVSPWKILNNEVIKKDIMRLDSNIDEFDFIEQNEVNKQVVIKSGIYTLNRNLIIPKGYSFIIEPGTVLSLENNAIILSYSKILWIGSQDNRITIKSSKNYQGSLVVFDVDEESIVEYVDFNKLSYPKVSDWLVSGSVNFYKSKVRISNVTILNNDAEDAINIVDGEFIIEDVFFKDIKSDALDIDFGRGVVRRSKFYNIGNDAIDTSGSVVEVNNIDIFDVNDKGISAGELSTIKGEGVNIDKAEIGITSKDGSSVILNKVDIANSRLGITAFQKKSEYSKAYIKLTEFQFKNLERLHAIEFKSSADVNEKHIDGIVKDVSNLLYGRSYGKKTNKIVYEKSR
jgi:hypothetical protein